MTSYVTDFICTYNLINEPEESEMLFRTQLLQAFTPKYFEDGNERSMDDVFDEINNITGSLYEKYSSHKTIKKLMNKFSNECDEIKFQMCFSYSTFYIMHRILCGIINNNLDEKICNNLIDNFDFV